MNLVTRRLLLAVSASVTTLLGAEVLLRIFLPQPGYDYPRGLFRADAAAGYRIAENFHGRLRTVGVDIAIDTNEAGLRSAPLRQGTPRILLLGDSFTFGYSVEAADTIEARLTPRLQGAFPDVEVLTAGAPGYGPHEEAALAESLLPALQPDLLIHFFFCGNDVADALRPPSGPRGRTVFRGRLVAQKVADRYPGLLGALRFECASAWESLHLVRLCTARSRGEDWASVIHDFHPDRNPTAQAAWLATTVGLDRLLQCARDAGTNVLLVAIPALIQADPERLARITDRPDAADQVLWPQQYLAVFAGSREVPFLDFTAAVRQNIERMPLYHPWDEHLNPAGNDLLAAEVARVLLAEGLLTPR